MKIKKEIYKLSRVIHWVSSAFCFAILLLFAATGITLNHTDWFSADMSSHEQIITLDKTLQQALQNSNEEERLTFAIQWVKTTLDLNLATRIEQDEIEITFDYPRPGGYTLVIFDIELGEVIVEDHSRGFVSKMNDLHKGRHSGLVWSWVIDISAALMLIFSITGLILLYQYSRNRPSTWPLLVIGLAIPFTIILVFVP